MYVISGKIVSAVNGAGGGSSRVPSTVKHQAVDRALAGDIPTRDEAVDAPRDSSLFTSSCLCANRLNLCDVGRDRTELVSSRVLSESVSGDPSVR